jgi:hypothetical protein
MLQRWQSAEFYVLHVLTFILHGGFPTLALKCDFCTVIYFVVRLAHDEELLCNVHCAIYVPCMV